MGERQHDGVDIERLWYSHIVAIDVAQEFASETGVRQRVRKVPPESNTFRCTWLIEEI